MSFVKPLVAAVAVACATITAHAGPVTFSGSSGSLAASATFDVVGGNLQVVLANTSTADVLVPSDVLTAVFFDAGGSSFSPLSALLSAGSSVFFDPQGQPAGGIVGGERAFGSASSGAPGARYFGISSSGLGGVFGDANFPGTNLDGPLALNGLNYGLLSAGDNSATGNGGLSGSGGLIKNSVSFELSIGSAGFSLADVGNVYFQYGTTLTEPGFACPIGSGCLVRSTVPEPGTLALAGLALLGTAAARRRRD